MKVLLFYILKNKYSVYGIYTYKSVLSNLYIKKLELHVYHQIHTCNIFGYLQNTGFSVDKISKVNLGLRRLHYINYK